MQTSILIISPLELEQRMNAVKVAEAVINNSLQCADGRKKKTKRTKALKAEKKLLLKRIGEINKELKQ